MPFIIGENVGPYRLIEKLGKGGMATVFKAYHPSLDRYVAIKALHPAFMEHPGFIERFEREEFWGTCSEILPLWQLANLCYICNASRSSK